MDTVQLACSCEKVTGKLDIPSKTKSFHIKCLCCDCQRFAKFLKNEKNILDAHGGSEIFQTHPSYIQLNSGEEHLACIKLGPKGLLRWYSACCNTPLVNTMGSAKIPFAGVSVKWMKFDNKKILNEKLGPVMMEAFAKYAVDEKPTGSYDKFPTSYMFKILAFMARGYWNGSASPSAFFKEGKPVAQPSII